MYLIFDTETTGLPQNFNAPLSDSENWPRMVQIAWQMHDENGELIKNNEKLHINESYTKNYGDALEFAIKCMPKKGESEIFSQVFRIIFAYKLAYLSVLNDENVMEIKYGSDKNA